MGRGFPSDFTDSTLEKPKLGLLREGLRCSAGASDVKLASRLKLEPWGYLCWEVWLLSGS